jgi:hypothetical protein
MIRTFRLTNEPGGLGLSCSPDGLALAGVPLLTKTAAGFEPRPAPEIEVLIKAAYGANGGPILLQSRLEAIAQALNSGDFGLAAIAAVQMRAPELSRDAAMRLARADNELGKYNYNPEEPRDWHGRWTRDGAARPVSLAPTGVESDEPTKPRPLGPWQRVAENTSPSTATTLSDANVGNDSSEPADNNASREPTSHEEEFKRKYDHLGPVDFAKEVIKFGDWLGRNGKDLWPDELAYALAEYRFLHDRLSVRLDQDYESATVLGNLLSAGVALYWGAYNAGLVKPGPLPDPMLVAAGVAVPGDGPPGRPYRMPRLKGAPAAAARVPKEVEAPGGIGEAEKPIQITLGRVEYTMPDWHMEEISYTKRADAEREALRVKFDDSVREAFVKDLAENHATELRDAGISDEGIALMVKGKVPDNYVVHHKLPLDDGGTNATNNLVLMKENPDHYLITNYQRQYTRGMSAGETMNMEWPMPDAQVRIWPKTPDSGAYPTVHKLKWLMPDSRLPVWLNLLNGGAYPHRTLTRTANMSEIDELLVAISADLREYGRTLRPPASPEAIGRLRRIARDKLRTDLPEGYLTFLGRTDGFNFNSYTIFAATEQKEPYRSGFVEVNEILSAGGEEYVFYGASSIDLYAQDRTSMAWVILDRPSLSVEETFPSFEALLERVLREAVA